MGRDVRAALWWAALACAVACARELDPAACGARFDVQRDKIIRTEESREMGARYLSELDVGARYECLRLCCETDACDVFVYEEKSPGSCYLFNCGPPEDFRCKFTAHGNFSSGVLALSRRLAELQDQERLHERERDRVMTSSTSTSTTTVPPPAPAPAAQPVPALPLPAHRQDPPPPASSEGMSQPGLRSLALDGNELATTLTDSLTHAEPHYAKAEPAARQQADTAAAGATTRGRCSRYQFECRRGGECIAVYNACDGVPQCADGSDEAPELGCPVPATAPPATPPPPPPAAPQRTPPPPPPLKNMQVVGDVIESDAVSSAEEAEGARWPHRLVQAQPQHRYNVVGDVSRGPHIFSHKGGLVQAEAPQFAPFEPPAPAPAPASAPWARRLWGPQTSAEWGGLSSGGAWGEPDPRRAWPVPQPRPEPELPMYMPSKTMPELPPAYADERHTLRDSPKKGLELQRAPAPAPAPDPPRPPLTTPAPVTPPTPPPQVHKEASSDKKQQGSTATARAQSGAGSAGGATAGGGGGAAGAGAAAGAGVAAQFAAVDERDGLSDRPPAAILLLVLGVGMTGVLGLVAGCRARRRRGRRGKSPFAHDADYLVNGMYL